jgi:hypothetical protein
VKATELAKVTGEVQGFAGDATELYYTSWDIYGGRGNLGKVRKDGQGAMTLASLDLEPRSLVLDATHVFYTAGIRLLSMPLAGGLVETRAPQFSAQAIAAEGSDVYGVPADYGPYDRVAKVGKKGGETKELASAKRPAGTPPNGFSAIAVDASGVYVTHSGAGRVLRFALDGGKPKVLASGLAKPYALALVGDSVYFTLAKKGDLMVVGTDGGTPRTLASGLVPETRVAADEKGIYTAVAGNESDDPVTVVRIPTEGGAAEPVATIPGGETVLGVALDARCVYWAQRKSASASSVHARAR